MKKNIYQQMIDTIDKELNACYWVIETTYKTYGFDASKEMQELLDQRIDILLDRKRKITMLSKGKY